jgi:hypothetical protein
MQNRFGSHEAGAFGFDRVFERCRGNVHHV